MLVNKNTKESKITIKRTWKNYTPSVAAEAVLSNLNVISNQFDNLSVQEQWNQLEHVMIESADLVAPLVEQGLVTIAKQCQPASTI